MVKEDKVVAWCGKFLTDMDKDELLEVITKMAVYYEERIKELQKRPRWLNY